MAGRFAPVYESVELKKDSSSKPVKLSAVVVDDPRPTAAFAVSASAISPVGAHSSASVSSSFNLNRPETESESSSSSSSAVSAQRSGTLSNSLLAQSERDDLRRLEEADSDSAAAAASNAKSDPFYGKNIHFPPIFVVPPISVWLIIAFVFTGYMVCIFVPTISDYLSDHGAAWKELLIYGSIPGISILFTYCHIWLALWMTFYPIQFFGPWQLPGTNVGLGWQGIIPFKAEKMARISVRLMTSKLISVREIFSRLDPNRVSAELVPYLRSVLWQIIDGVSKVHSPEVWALLPAKMKLELLNKAIDDSPAVIDGMMNDVKERVEELFDIEDMVIRALTRDKALLNNIFISCGYKELVFIRNSGAVMGGIFGFIQMIIWLFYPADWMVPVFGLVVGTITNWLALKMIFRPINPHYLCGIKIQGLFLQRQAEVSDEYARVIAKHILNAKNILAAIIAGPTTEKMFAIVNTHVADAIERVAGAQKTAAKMTMGEKNYANLKQDLCDRIMEFLPESLGYLEQYAEEALDVENTLRVKMAGLPPAEFEGLLHPVFEEDEWKLILMGGVLGAIIGVIQIYILAF